MNINEKQRLWSKYYLTNPSNSRDDLFSLITFVKNETSTLELSKEQERLKIRKTVKYMLKYLNKKQIIRKYYGIVKNVKNSDRSKNEIITRLTRYI